MRIAVFSDTHGFTAPMVDAVSRFRPDAVFHLGDHDRDTEVLLRQFPEIPLYNVAGNCDLRKSCSVSFRRSRSTTSRATVTSPHWRRMCSRSRLVRSRPF